MIVTCSTPKQEENFSPSVDFFGAKLGNMYQFMETIAGRSAALTKVRLDFIKYSRPENFCVSVWQSKEHKIDPSDYKNLIPRFSSFLPWSSYSFDALKASNPQRETRAKRDISQLFYGWLQRMNGRKILIMRKSARVTRPGTDRLVEKCTGYISGQFSEYRGGFNYVI